MTGTYPSVAIVILNWNGKLLLEKFLPSVVQNEYINCKIYVGDNASTDDSISFLKDKYPEITLIVNDYNYGFAKGYNEVLKFVEADYFILLNSDVEVSKNWVSPVINLMEQDKSIAVAQPKIKSFHDKQLFEYAGAAGGFIDYLGYPFCRGRIFDQVELDNGQYDTSGEIFWASGCAFFIRKQAWLQSGGFDEQFFAHMEEIDLCWRLKVIGYKIYYVSESYVYHVGGGTLNSDNPQKTYLNFRNNLLMIWKNMPNKSIYWVLTLRIILDFVALLLFIFKGKFKNGWAVSKAHQHFFKLIFTKYKNYKTLNYSKLNLVKLYNKSIVIQYFIKRKNKFSELD